MLLIIMALIFVLCFLIYQWWFQSSRFRNMPEVTRSKVKPYNRPLAWALYSLIVFLAVIALIGYQIMVMMDYIMQLDM